MMTAWMVAAAATGLAAPALAASAASEPLGEPGYRDGSSEALQMDSDVEAHGLLDGGSRRAAGRWGPEVGDFEFTLTGAASNDGGFEHGALGVDASFGYYVTRDVSLELRQGVAYQDAGDSFWTGSTRVAADYHFDFDRLRPFVGVTGGGFYGEQLRDSGSLGLEGGVKYYAKPDTFVYGRVEHHWLFRGGSTGERVFGNRRILYTIGIGFNF